MSPTAEHGELISDIVARQVRLRPHKVCLVDGSVRLTYRDVDDASDHIAAYLRGLGVKRGDVVGIQLPNWSEHVLTLFAAAKIGAAASLIPETHRANEVRRALALTNPRVVVVPRMYRGFDFPAMYASLAPDGQPPRVLIVDRDAGAGMGFLRRFRPSIPSGEVSKETWGDVRVAPDDPVVIFFTSGTEGEFKAAVHSHRTLGCTVWPLLGVLELTADDVSLVMSPLSTPAGLPASTLTVLSQGGTVVLLEHFEARAALTHIAAEGVTILAGTPAHLQLLLSTPDRVAHQLESLRIVRLSGAFAPPRLVADIQEQLKCRVAVGYGMTETGMVTLTRADDPVEIICETAGRPLPGMEVGIFGEGGERLGPGQAGRLAARGPSLFVGYLDQSGAIRSVTDPDGWLLTGDLGSLDADANLHFVGRHKELINRGGVKISPVEIETLLLDHPRVEWVAVVAMPDDRLGERSCAYVVPPKGQTITLEELVDFLRQRGVATYKLPERLETLEELPLTRNLKVMKETLRSDIARKLEGERAANGRADAN